MRYINSSFMTPINRTIHKNSCVLTSPMLISASVYCRPFCNMLNNADGGTRAPLMLD